MRKLISLLLGLCLCISLAACGNSGSTTSPYATEEPEWSIDIQTVSDIITGYIDSEGYNTAVDEFEAIFERDAQRLYVNWAMEYKLDDIDGYAVHYILIDVSGDVMDRYGSVLDRFTLLYDMSDGCTYSGAEADVAGWLESWSGACTGAEDARFMYLMMNGRNPGDIFWSEWEIYKTLTDDEVAAVNTALGLRPYEQWYGNNENGEPVVQPAVIETAPETRVQMVIDTAREFIVSGHYEQVALEGAELRVMGAMEYKINDMNGHPMHVIIVHVDGVDCEHHSMADYVLMDMEQARVLCHTDIDYNSWTDFDRVEDLYAICALGYQNVLTGADSSVWQAEMEAVVHLTEDEIITVNQEIGE